MALFKIQPDHIDCCEVVDSAIIERWREYIKHSVRGEKHRTIDAIFDCAIQGAGEARDADKLARQMLKEMLRNLAKSV